MTDEFYQSFVFTFPSLLRLLVLVLFDSRSKIFNPELSLIEGFHFGVGPVIEERRQTVLLSLRWGLDAGGFLQDRITLGSFFKQRVIKL